MTRMLTFTNSDTDYEEHVPASRIVSIQTDRHGFCVVHIDYGNAVHVQRAKETADVLKARYERLVGTLDPLLERAT